MVALVLDGDQRAALAITRALGRRGIEVVVGESCALNLSSSSRYCHAALTYASPTHDPSRFQAEIIQAVKAGSYRVLIPVTDVTLALISQIRPLLARDVQVPIPKSGAVETALDKERLFRLAQALGVPTPTTYFVEDPRQVEELAPKLSYPVVIKPRRSWTAREGVWIKSKVEYALDAPDLLAKYPRAHRRAPLPMLQELVVGPGCGIFALMDHGEPRASFAHLRLREKPPWGGESVLRESIPMDPVLQEYALRLLRSLSWHGVAMVEFKRDQAGRLPKLMEINGRFWGSLQLAIDAGINFPHLLYQMATNGEVETPRDYRVGVRSRWLLGDLESLLLTLLGGSPFGRKAPGRRFGRSSLTRGLADAGVFRAPGRLRALADFMRPSHSHEEIFSWDDPRPWTVEIGHSLRKIRAGQWKKLLP